MHALIIHCHPEPRSFNGALTRVTASTLGKRGYAVTISDLYADDFDAIEHPKHYRQRADTEHFSPLTEQRSASEAARLPEDVEREIQRLQEADLVIFQFPLWWHGPPAMLKGWFDRVFVYGALYTSKRRYDCGHFLGKRAICSVTTGAPAAAFGPGARGGDMAVMMWPLLYSLHYMGFDVLPPFFAHGIQGGGMQYQAEEAFRRHLKQHEATWTERLRMLDQTEKMAFPGWNDWDSLGAFRDSQT